MQNIPIRTEEGRKIREAFLQQLEADPLGPGPHNPMFGMFGDEIILEGVGGICTLGYKHLCPACGFPSENQNSGGACRRCREAEDGT